jgi:DNA-binding XRE family transcriptional regulator
VLTVGERLQLRFDTPFIPSFPVGFAGTIRFIQEVADSIGVKSTRAVREEKSLQDEILAEFEDIAGTSVTFDPPGMTSDSLAVAREIAGHFDITIDHDGCMVPLQVSPPIGTNGIRHLLHRWRRSLHA